MKIMKVQRQNSEEMTETGVRAMLGGLESGERWFLERDVGEQVAHVLEGTRGLTWSRCALHLSVSGASGRSFGSAWCVSLSVKPLETDL